MTRTLFAAALIACTTALAGCHIYFGEDRDGRADGGYSYCDETGCWYCDDFGCVPDGSGWTCDSNDDCLAGCYCDDGYCEEAGLCAEDSDCPDGFVCDGRDSCVPEGSETCNDDGDCEAGAYCDEASGACVDSGTCTDDAGCGEGAHCDEARGTCEPDEPQACQAMVVCNVPAPDCEQGTNPGIVDGCYSGECIADELCTDGAPVNCDDHTSDDACQADATCDAVYRGLNCTRPDGGSCTEGSANCTCESFVFDECVDAAP